VVPPPGPDRLSHVLERVREDVFEPEFVSDAPLIRFEAFARNSRVFGWLRLDADRLTDLLNAHLEIGLDHVEVENLDDGTTSKADSIVISRDELIAVHATGPRGDAELRRRTRPHAIALQSGSYLVGGHLHAPVGTDALESYRSRPPMVPLTDAWVEYWSGGRRRRQWIGTIVVNRDLAEWVRIVTDDDLAFGHIRPKNDAPRSVG
jgi:hypothetical protein